MIAKNEIITAIVGKLSETPSVVKAVLFGSRARGDNSETSDYDIAVFGTLTTYEKAALRYTCDNELSTLHKIDLVFMQDVNSPALIKNINKDGITFYENK